MSLTVWDVSPALIFNVFQAIPPNANANVLLAALLPIDMRCFAAKHVDVALSVNLTSKDFVQIAVATTGHASARTAGVQANGPGN
jgi:hypothetical protein